jgi:hypothetical protein
MKLRFPVWGNSRRMAESIAIHDGHKGLSAKDESHLTLSELNLGCIMYLANAQRQAVGS